MWVDGCRPGYGWRETVAIALERELLDAVELSESFI